jgi:hypothetical protein
MRLDPAASRCQAGRSCTRSLSTICASRQTQPALTGVSARTIRQRAIKPMMEFSAWIAEHSSQQVSGLANRAVPRCTRVFVSLRGR